MAYDIDPTMKKHSDYLAFDVNAKSNATYY